MRASRRVLVPAALAALASTVSVQPASAQRAPVADSPSSAESGGAAATGQDSNATGAIGFVLIGGWMLGGVLLFRQGRRRLAAHKSVPAQHPMPDDGDSGSAAVTEEEHAEHERPAVVPAGADSG
jgi:hypothetical protein